MHVFCFFAQSDLAGIPEQNRRANFWYTTHNFLNFEILEVPGGHDKNNNLAAEWITKLLKTWPTAKVEASALTGRGPLTVDFKAIAQAPNGRIATYVWQFGDGGVSIHQTTSHTFIKPKVYNVFLTVIDGDGHQEYAQVDIDVK
jgi:PKD repeat protein